MGRRAQLVAGAPGPGGRLPELLLGPRRAAQLRPAGPAGRSPTPSASAYQRTGPILTTATPRPPWRSGRLDQRPDDFSPAKQSSSGSSNTAFPAGDNVDAPLRPLHLRLDQRRPPTTTASSSSRHGSQGWLAGRRRPGRRRVGRIKVSLPGARAGPDGRLLRQGDRHRAGPVAVPRSTTRRSPARTPPTPRSAPAGVRRPSRRRWPATSRRRPRRDFAPLEAGIVDEETYVEQGAVVWERRAHLGSTCPTSSRTLAARSRTCSCSAPRSTDEFSTSSWGCDPNRHRRRRNPYYDDVEDDDVAGRPGRDREGYIRSAYERRTRPSPSAAICSGQ